VHDAINLPIDYRVGVRANKWIVKQIAKRYLPAELIYRNKMGFPIPLADYVRPLASMAFFADGFCEQELGLHRLGLERLLADWRRWVHFFFGLVTLEIWGRLHFRRDSIEAISEEIRKRERECPAQAS
jgi:asparagine synthase (glutamine-hydrolysing)